MKELMNTIHCMDSLEFMKTLPDKCIDLCLCDPPYGINIASKESIGGVAKIDKKWNNPRMTKFEISDWDSKIPDKEYFKELIRVSKNQIIFGGNYFIKYLDNSRCWIVWNKKNGDSNFADCELARTSFNSSVRMFSWKWAGMFHEKGCKEIRQHPTQKPKELFKWCLENYSKPGDIILDCFAGSGTTAVASIECGRNYIVIEKEEKYCEIIKKRIATTTPPLFCI